MIALKNPPKDIQEGTANHVAMICNACEAGNAQEAGYLATDLLDQLASGKNLIVTQYVVAPLNHVQVAAYEAIIKEAEKQAYERGFRDGCMEAADRSRKELIAKIVEAIR